MNRSSFCETCTSSALSYLPAVVSVSLIGLIRLSLYESSIRSSIPTSYLPHSTKEKLCFKSLLLLLHILGFSWCQCHSEVLEGDSWFVAELQRNMQYFLGVSECVREAEEKEAAVLPTLSPITWADCRAERGAGRQPYSPSSGPYCRWYAENAHFLAVDRLNSTYLF